MAKASPLVEPAHSTADATVTATLAETIHRKTGLRHSSRQYPGWLGFECSSVRAAVWMTRALVVSNILSRREETALFVPVNPDSDPNGDIVANALTRVHRLAGAKGVFP
jgi:sirohydrochlorin cobaltochelatase